MRAAGNNSEHLFADTETVFDTSPIPITREIAPLNAAAVDFLLTILFKLNKLNLLAS